MEQRHGVLATAGLIIVTASFEQLFGALEVENPRARTTFNKIKDSQQNDCREEGVLSNLVFVVQRGRQKPQASGFGVKVVLDESGPREVEI